MTGLKLAASAYLLPFLFVLNPALLLQGPWTEVAIVAVTAITSGALLARAVDPPEGAGLLGLAGSLALFGLAVAIGGSTLWLGRDTVLALVPAAAVLALPLLRSPTIRAIFGVGT